MIFQAVELPGLITTSGFSGKTWLRRDFGLRGAVVGVCVALATRDAGTLVSIFIEYGEGSKLEDTLPWFCTDAGI